MERWSWFHVRKRGRGVISGASGEGAVEMGVIGRLVLHFLGENSVSSGQNRIVFGWAGSGVSRGDGGGGVSVLVGGLG